ncbi:MAG: hypothetical protein IH591_01295 [Bacteroidales bacterium]|nr:hypothetical protein [Bacteroidales bacterium]
MTNPVHDTKSPSGSESSSDRQRIVRYSFYYIIAALTIYYFIMASIVPVRYVRSLNQQFMPDTSDQKGKVDGLQTDSLFLSMMRQLALTRARMMMAATDSIGLTVNLPDSVATLEINGVTVRKVRIIDFRIAGSLEGVREDVWPVLLSEPFTIESDLSSIQKEPLMVKIAPRDTAEASAMPNIVPDTSGVEPVFYCLRLSHGIRLTVLQEVDKGSPDAVSRNRFLYRRSLRDFYAAVKDVARFRFPFYQPEIRIVVPKDDARIIYRALPQKGNVVLYVR